MMHPCGQVSADEWLEQYRKENGTPLMVRFLSAFVLFFAVVTIVPFLVAGRLRRKE